VYSETEDLSELLASAHRESLRVAREAGARTVAFPAISTGVYGYPVELAAPIAVRTAVEAPASIEEVRFVLYDEHAYDVFARALGDAGA
jgi:O-acetyl-ADP-ribose deacetylase (regulator of RNase III)